MSATQLLLVLIAVVSLLVAIAIGFTKKPIVRLPIKESREGEDIHTKELPEEGRNRMLYERLFELVLRIPYGRVMTFGLIGCVLGRPYHPRFVASGLMSASINVPGHRVIMSNGRCPSLYHQALLETEGVVFDGEGRCDLTKYLWTPPEYEAEANHTDINQKSLFD